MAIYFHFLCFSATLSWLVLLFTNTPNSLFFAWPLLRKKYVQAVLNHFFQIDHNISAWLNLGKWMAWQQGQNITSTKKSATFCMAWACISFHTSITRVERTRSQTTQGALEDEEGDKSGRFCFLRLNTDSQARPFRWKVRNFTWSNKLWKLEQSLAFILENAVSISLVSSLALDRSLASSSSQEIFWVEGQTKTIHVIV